MFNGTTIHTLHFTKIASTNSWAKEHAHTLNTEALTCITADEQTAGRGQHEKTWFSPSAGNLYITFFFVLPTNFDWRVNLGQVFALSTAAVLQELGLTPELKWPNDILLGEKKAGGILCETTDVAGGLGIILGMGLNVHIDPKELDHVGQAATSLAAHTSNLPSLSILKESLLQKFLLYLQKIQKEGFAPLAKEYNHLLAYKNKEVTFSHQGEAFSAICQNVDEQGWLILKCRDGEERHFHSGSLKFSDK